MKTDYFAKLKETREKQKSSNAKYRGKTITLHRCANPEMRIFIRDNNRGMLGASFSTAPVRNGFTRSKKRYYYESGATVLRDYEVFRFAAESEYDFAKFRQLLRDRLGREIAPSEAREFIDAAAKSRNVETLAFAKRVVPKGVKVYAK